MREVHNGLLYDTEDAECLGSYKNLYVTTTVYRTQSGRYFATHTGGAFSPIGFGKPKINPWGNDEKVVVDHLEGFGSPAVDVIAKILGDRLESA